MVLSDEIYEYIIYEGEHVSMAAFSWMKERVMVVNGFSKGFAMTGWRIGYVAGPLWVARACAKLQGQQTSGACSIAQMAAVTAYANGMEAPLAMREAFLRRRELMLNLASQIEGLEVQTPPGAFYLFPDVRAFLGKRDGSRLIEDANDLSMYLLEKAHVACVSGSAFGSPGNLRISYAAGDDQLTEAMKRIKRALENLK
jgi:aspartate aminotransferase